MRANFKKEKLNNVQRFQNLGERLLFILALLSIAVGAYLKFNNSRALEMVEDIRFFGLVERSITGNGAIFCGCMIFIMYYYLKKLNKPQNK